jgi:hypothetical protein
VTVLEVADIYVQKRNCVKYVSCTGMLGSNHGRQNWKEFNTSHGAQVRLVLKFDVQFFS